MFEIQENYVMKILSVAKKVNAKMTHVSKVVKTIMAAHMKINVGMDQLVGMQINMVSVIPLFYFFGAYLTPTFIVAISVGDLDGHCSFG